MNGIEKIIETIIADAEAKKEATLAAARTESEAIAERHLEELNQRNELLKTEAAAKAEQTRLRIIANAELEARKSLLAQKQALIDEAFTAAMAKLKGYSAEQATALLAQLAAQATVSGAEQVLLNAQAQTAYGQAVVDLANQKLAAAKRPANLKLAAESRNIGLGLILKEEAIEINCELEKLVWDAREALSMEVASLLFNS